jgi:hypothetical protein
MRRDVRADEEGDALVRDGHREHFAIARVALCEQPPGALDGGEVENGGASTVRREAFVQKLKNAVGKKQYMQLCRPPQPRWRRSVLCHRSRHTHLDKLEEASHEWYVLENRRLSAQEQRVLQEAAHDDDADGERGGSEYREGGVHSGAKQRSLLPRGTRRVDDTR